MEGVTCVVRSIPGWWALPGTTYAPPLGEGTKESMSADSRSWRKTAPGAKVENCCPRTHGWKRNLTARHFHRAVKKLPAGAGDFPA